MAVISNGTTLIDNGILDAAVPTGKFDLLSTQTASASATISFTSGIDSTYDSYVFKFIIFTQLQMKNGLQLVLEMVERIMMLQKLQLCFMLIMMKVAQMLVWVI
jgi:hypothetical protein